MSRGARDESSELADRAGQVAKRDGLPDRFIRLSSAAIDALIGYPDAAQAAAREVHAADPTADRSLSAALILGLTGAADEALVVIAEKESLYPKASQVHRFGAPQARAAIALAKGEPQAALQFLESLLPHDRSALTIPYVRGLAYLAAARGEDAVAEFQKAIDWRGIDPVSPLHSLAHLGVARGYALTGDLESARKSYQDFLALWQNADPDIPIYQEAQAEYADLQKR